MITLNDYYWRFMGYSAEDRRTVLEILKTPIWEGGKNGHFNWSKTIRQQCPEKAWTCGWALQGIERENAAVYKYLLDLYLKGENSILSDELEMQRALADKINEVVEDVEKPQPKDRADELIDVSIRFREAAIKRVSELEKRIAAATALIDAQKVLIWRYKEDFKKAHLHANELTKILTS